MRRSRGRRGTRAPRQRTYCSDEIDDERGARARGRAVSATLTSTPAADGFRMPGEFEPHSGCWMVWPERPDNWRLAAAPAQAAFAAVAEAINAAEPVTVARLRSACRAAPARLLAELDSRRRDRHRRRLDARHRPELRGRRARRACAGSTGASTPGAGATVGCTPAGSATSASRARCSRSKAAERYRAPLVLEGGSIHVDGEGTVLTHRGVPAEPEPQPRHVTRRDRAHLLEHLGAERMIWLGAGMVGDETDGHVDNLACFARPGVVLLSWTEDDADPQHRGLARRARAPAAALATRAGARSRSCCCRRPAR